MAGSEHPPAPVRQLHEVRTPASEAVCVMLRSWLEKAERGEILAIGIAGHRRGGGTATAYEFEPDGDIAHLAWALRELEHRLHNGSGGGA